MPSVVVIMAQRRHLICLRNVLNRPIRHIPVSSTGVIKPSAIDPARHGTHSRNSLARSLRSFLLSAHETRNNCEPVSTAASNAIEVGSPAIIVAGHPHAKPGADVPALLNGRRTSPCLSSSLSANSSSNTPRPARCAVINCLNLKRLKLPAVALKMSCTCTTLLGQMQPFLAQKLNCVKAAVARQVRPYHWIPNVKARAQPSALRGTSPALSRPRRFKRNPSHQRKTAGKSPTYRQACH